MYSEIKMYSDRIQEAHDLLDKVEMPTGEGVVVLKYAKGENKGAYVLGIDHKQKLLLGQLMSKEVFPNEDFRYTLFPVQKSYDLVYSDLKKFIARSGEIVNLKELSKDYWFPNREVILEEDIIIPDPIVLEIEGKVVYGGKLIEAEIDIKDVFYTLIKAGLFKESRSKPVLHHGKICFENGESSIRSIWLRYQGCFSAVAFRPSGKYSYGLPVFGKTDEKVES